MAEPQKRPEWNEYFLDIAKAVCCLSMKLVCCVSAVCLFGIVRATCSKHTYNHKKAKDICYFFLHNKMRLSII